jgi:hypothetical protein
LSASENHPGDQPPGPPHPNPYDLAPWLRQVSEFIIRPQEDPADAQLRRFKDRFRFIVSWSAVVIVGGVALYTAKTSTIPDERHWAQTIVVSLVTALGGYALGRSEHR